MNGDKGSFDLTPEEISKVRRKECLSSAALIGAEWRGLGIPDGTLIWNEKIHVKMIQALQDQDRRSLQRTSVRHRPRRSVPAT